MLSARMHRGDVWAAHVGGNRRQCSNEDPAEEKSAKSATPMLGIAIHSPTKSQPFVAARQCQQ